MARCASCLWVWVEERLVVAYCFDREKNAPPTHTTAPNALVHKVDKREPARLARVPVVRHVDAGDLAERREKVAHILLPRVLRQVGHAHTVLVAAGCGHGLARAAGAPVADGGGDVAALGARGRQQPPVRPVLRGRQLGPGNEAARSRQLPLHAAFVEHVFEGADDGGLVRAGKHTLHVIGRPLRSRGARLAHPVERNLLGRTHRDGVGGGLGGGVAKAGPRAPLFDDLWWEKRGVRWFFLGIDARSNRLRHSGACSGEAGTAARGREAGARVFFFVSVDRAAVHTWRHPAAPLPPPTHHPPPTLTLYIFFSTFSTLVRVVTLTVSPLAFFLYSTRVLIPFASGPVTLGGGSTVSSSSSTASPQRTRWEVAMRGVVWGREWEAKRRELCFLLSTRRSTHTFLRFLFSSRPARW